MTGAPLEQAPDWQLSLFVHASPSLHGVPSTAGVPPAQAPAWQLSLSVQPLPSLHGLPSAFAGLEHEPSPGLQTPAS